ncbi:MAG: glycine cleavage T C-terminal barrel domain-containing protein [Planctomycetota bacterium]
MAHQSPLREHHLKNDATLMPYGPPALPVELVESFGEVDFEYAAIRKACVLIDQPNRGTLVFTGDDRLAFLNSMLTQELKGLEPFQTRRGLWLNRKGRIVADLRLTELGDRIVADADIHAIDATVDSLNSYIIADDVEIENTTDTQHRIALHGPTAGPLLEAVCEQREDGTDGPLVSVLVAQGNTSAACNASIGGVACLLERNDIAGELGVDITAPTSGVASVYTRLLEAGSAAGSHAGEHTPTALAAQVKLRQSGWLALNTARIEAGTPMLFVDFSTESLPAETGPAFLNARVSFTKGCYLGQEVVARMHSLGKPKQVLVGLKPTVDPPRDADGFPLQPLGGAAVSEPHDREAQVGLVTSSTISPMLGGTPVALAIVKTAHATEGAELNVVCEGTTVAFRVQSDLRFYTPA